jgi:hypothetical protein
MAERRDTSLDKEVGLSPHNSVRLFLPVLMLPVNFGRRESRGETIRAGAAK